MFSGTLLHVPILDQEPNHHSQESRHAFGMRALGLPNTKHFHEITRIEDCALMCVDVLCTAHLKPTHTDNYPNNSLTFSIVP
jgi:hypothetical protein